MATINTRILLRYDTYENWSKTDVELKGGNFVLKKGEVGFCEVPSDNTAATTAPTVLFKVGDGTNAFKDLKWASALAADVYSWAKENKITIVKNGTGNVISNIEWDAAANNGKGGIKFSTIDVYTKTESDNLYAKKKTANGGFAGGSGASATSGGAIGNRAKTENGGAIGDGASSLSGGAIGSGAKTSYGFAGGKDAKTIDSDGFGIDAIQLGTGTNNTVRSLQVYDYTLMNPDGSIPAERLTNAATPEELERLQYYGDKDIVPSDESYFIVHGASNSITGLTDAGKTQTELLIPYKINGVKIKRIKRSAFANCTSLTSVIIPNSVTNIGINAFSGCTSLTSVIIPNNVTSIGQSAFDGCTGLTSVIIPNSITSIGENAFSGCSSLTSINIPNSITNIGSGTFSSCTGLTSVIIPNSITSIGGNAFTHCTSLTSINIPNSVTSIGGNAFWCCSSLTSINIPNSVTGIGNDAFDGITPSQLTVYCEQGSYAETYAKNNGYNIVYTDVSNITTTEELERLQYYGDKNIIPSDESYFVVNETGETITGLTDAGKTQTELVIPYEVNGKKITTLYSEVDHMFEPQSILDGSTTITKVTIPKSVTTLGRGVFDHCTSLESINIPDSVKTIDEYAFTYCTSLTSIKLPNSITTIGENAFNNCSGLTSIEIANGIKSIGAAMFSFCNNLETIYIPDSITSIGEDAFNGCTSLKRINIPKAVTQLGEFTFDGATNLTIYCEKDAYAESYAEIFNIPVVYTDINKDYFNNYVSKDGSNTISGTIDASSGSILVSEPTSDTQAANKKYVDDSITAGIQANDAMTFKGLLGGEGNITELPTDIATVRNGDTYKVSVDGIYNEIAAKSGDMFIALVKNSTVSWQFIPSADDGNVLANNDLTADALIVGNGSKEIKTLDNGSNDQILRIVNNVPAWEKEYEVVASDTSITVTKDTENKQYKVSVNSIEVSKLTQTDGTVLILNGGNSAN